MSVTPVPREEWPVETRSTIPVSKRWPVPAKGKRVFEVDGRVLRFCGHCRLPRPVEEFGRDATTPDGLYEACNSCRQGRRAYHLLESVGAVPPQSKQSWAPEFPTVVTLCGSTRFWQEFQEAAFRETLEGRIVLSIGAATGSDDDHFAHMSRDERDAVKEALDELHKRKIDMSDEILVLNVRGYVGPSTRSEVEYAREHGKRVRFLEPPTEDYESF